MGARRASRVDDNQRLLVELWRKMGASVLILSEVGHGCPDVLVGFNGLNALCEIKDGSKVPSKQKLTALEEEFHDNWRGHVCIIKDEEEAQKLIYRMRDKNGSEFMLRREY
jgi:hypothetical protein